MNLFLRPDEQKFVAMAVISLITQIKETSQNQGINWTPEVRKDLKGMMVAGTTLSIKLQRLGFDMSELPPFLEGDESEFLTKES